jgi:ribosome-associated toxin RatA of RatAB toxin-antitoxin module
MVALAVPASFHAPGDWLTVALPRPADDCYELFCDVERAREWLPVLSSIHVSERDRAGRPARVAFQASLQRASIGYTCTYRYRGEERQVAWSTPQKSSIVVRGMAQFQPIADRACLMTYALELKVGKGLPAFADRSYANHPSSSTLAEFRDFVRRTL